MATLNRLYLTFDNEQFNLRIQPHTDDDTKLVVKSKHPEAIDQLVILSGKDLGIVARISGDANFICICDKTTLLGAIAIALAHVALPKHDEVIEPYVEPPPAHLFETQGEGADDIEDA